MTPIGGRIGGVGAVFRVTRRRGLVGIMAFVEKRGPGRWRARYRGPDGRERSRTFGRKTDASAWLTAETAKLQRGEWTDPARGKLTVGVISREWLARQVSIKPSTRQRYDSLLRVHVLPRWEDVRLDRVAYEDVAKWVASMTAAGLAPSSVRQAHRVLALVLHDAVRAKRIPTNVAEGVALPRVTRTEPRFLTAAEVALLADAAGQYRPLVLFLAYTGVRFGEAAALRVGRVDLLRRRATIAESVTEVNGTLVTGSTKSHQTRTVPIPNFLLDDMMAATAGKRPDAYVFTSPDGGQLRLMNWRRRTFDPAARAAGLVDLSPHDLRHTAASLAISSGANVKSVQRMLGHASAAMTLDTYAGLFGDDLDAVADRMAALHGSAAASLRPVGTVVPLERSS